MANLARSKANIKVAGISSWKVRETTKTEFHTLPYLRDGKVTLETLFATDSKGQQFPFAIKFDASAKCMATGDLPTLEVLDSMMTLDIDSQITAVNATTFDTSLLTPDFGGFRWRFVSDADRDADRYIEFFADRTILLTELATFTGTVTESSNDATSTLAPLDSIAITDIIPAGIKTVTCSAAGGNGTDDDWGIIRNSSFIMETLATQDQYGRSCPYAVKIDLEFDAIQSSSTELGLIDDIAGRQNKYVITFVDDLVATLDYQLGISWTYRNESDSNDVSLIHVVGSGIVPSSSIDGILAKA